MLVRNDQPAQVVAAALVPSVQTDPERRAPDRVNRPIRVLSLDGGGYRSFSSLLILQQLLKWVDPQTNSPPQHPCEYFDLIVGTSTGGLIALMLGRLGLSIEDTIRLYLEMGPRIFGEEGVERVLAGGKFDAGELERCMVELGGNKAMLVQPNSIIDPSCYTAVTTTHAELTIARAPLLLRSYPSVESLIPAGHSWTLAEAARATSATPTYFDPVVVSGGKFEDAATSGQNNPTELALEEVKRLKIFDGKWKGRSGPVLVVSIGTGVGTLVRRKAEDLVATPGAFEALTANLRTPNSARSLRDVHVNRTRVSHVRPAPQHVRLDENEQPLRVPKERFPPRPALFGREIDVSEVEQLLKPPLDGEFTPHVALVGLGGIGKTSLATEIGHRVKEQFGRRSFIRCERLLNLRAFQEALLLNLRTKSPGKDEVLADSIMKELENEPHFLVLDNLLDVYILDKPLESLDDYLNYISDLADISTATLLITSRNTELCSDLRPRRPIHRHDVRELGPRASDELFRKEFCEPRDFELGGANEATLQDLLRLLDGIPLAIQLVATHARFRRNLEDVVTQWKNGVAWDKGRKDRLRSLKFSFNLSFSDPALQAPSTIAFLRLLARLPQPVPRSYLPDDTIDAIRKTSIGQVEKAGEGSVVKFLEPVRQFILRDWQPKADFGANSDATNDVVCTLGISYFSDAIKGKYRGEEKRGNFRLLLDLTEGMFGNGIEAARVGALLSFDAYYHEDLVRHLMKLLKIEDTVEFSISDYREVSLFRISTDYLRDILKRESDKFSDDCAEYWLEELESGSEIVADSDRVGKLPESPDSAEVAPSRLKGTRLFQFITSYFPATSLSFLIRLLTPKTQTQALEAALEQAKRCKLNILTARILNVMGGLARRVDGSFLDYLVFPFYMFDVEPKPNGSVQASNYFREEGDVWRLSGDLYEAARAYERAGKCMPKDTKENVAAGESLCILALKRAAECPKLSREKVKFSAQRHRVLDFSLGLLHKYGRPYYSSDETDGSEAPQQKNFKTAVEPTRTNYGILTDPDFVDKSSDLLLADLESLSSLVDSLRRREVVAFI
ncbi:hypothetical protein P7C70_g7357, partial [Phenoliferia sp. Uapishka_3]